MSKDSGGFFSKVVRFVSNPTTDWAALDNPPTASPESEYAKTEIKAMIERKRRNDFVRKRELDMLRKIRREGLSQDNALALAGASNFDTDSRPLSGPRSDITVKDKIDAIEQQMVGDQSGSARTTAPTAKAKIKPYAPPAAGLAQNPYAPTSPHDHSFQDPAPKQDRIELLPLEFDPPEISKAVLDAARANIPKASGAIPVLTNPLAPTGFSNEMGLQVTEMEHDPELDEAVIAFANADFDGCEKALQALIAPNAPRHTSTETWMALFDLYRAIDQSAKFDHLATLFAHQFGLSAPHWYSLPDRVSSFLAQNPSTDKSGPIEAGVSNPTTPQPESPEGWLAPVVIDSDAVSQLRSELLQLPKPWILDWSAVNHVSPEGAVQLSQLIKSWAKEAIELRWIGVNQLLSVLTDMAPSGVKDADPAHWMLRLDALRMCNRPDQFDEVAIDYCVTYELSPPSWEPCACKVKLMDDGTTPHSMMLSHISEVTTSFVESQIQNEVEFVQVAELSLSGQLVGDISETLRSLDDQLGSSMTLDIDCEHLLRVDFIAAGDLLNWVLARRSEERQVTFVKPQRLVALFFGAMGINEHAKIILQQT